MQGRARLHRAGQSDRRACERSRGCSLAWRRQAPPKGRAAKRARSGADPLLWQAHSTWGGRDRAWRALLASVFSRTLLASLCTVTKFADTMSEVVTPCTSLLAASWLGPEANRARQARSRRPERCAVAEPPGPLRARLAAQPSSSAAVAAPDCLRAGVHMRTGQGCLACLARKRAPLHGSRHCANRAACCPCSLPGSPQLRQSTRHLKCIAWPSASLETLTTGCLKCEDITSLAKKEKEGE